MKCDGDVVDSVNGFDIIFCETCGFYHVHPYPSDEEMVKFYRNDFYQTAKPDYISEMEEDREWWNLCYDERLNLVGSVAPLNSFTRVLDVGCGVGMFMERCRERGHKEIVGVEPSSIAREYARSNGFVVYETLDEVPGEYDVICCAEVLEHVVQPIHFIKKLAAKLSTNGALLIVVPNDYNSLQRELYAKKIVSRKYWLAPPQHVNYFDALGLHNAVEDTGELFVEKCTTTFPMELFIMMGMNYVDNPELGRTCHAMRKNLDLALSSCKTFPSLKREMAEFFEQRDLGRELVAVARPTQLKRR